jgi:hypothetical protein
LNILAWSQVVQGSTWPDKIVDSSLFHNYKTFLSKVNATCRVVCIRLRSKNLKNFAKMKNYPRCEGKTRKKVKFGASRAIRLHAAGRTLNRLIRSWVLNEIYIWNSNKYNQCKFNFKPWFIKILHTRDSNPEPKD